MRKTDLRLAFLLAMAPIPLMSEPARARPNANPWTMTTEVASDEPLNPACERLTAALARKVSAISGLKARIESLEKRGPQTVKGMLQSWMGQSNTSQKIADQKLKMKKEMATAEELNTLARSMGCPATDIDQQLKLEATKVAPPEPPQ